MERRQAWIATAAVMVTVILSAIGATWVIGRNTATREDVTQLRNEVTQVRNEVSQLRNEIKAEIRAGRESADAQMQELRGYIVQHLEQHDRDGE